VCRSTVPGSHLCTALWPELPFYIHIASALSISNIGKHSINMSAGSSRFVPNSSDPRHPREVPAGTRHPHYSSVGSSLADAMSIPRTQQAVPPPLPPPSFIPEIASGNDLGWRWGNESSTTQFGRAPSMSNASANVRPGSSLHGGSYLRDADRQFDDQDRSPRTYAMNDERHSSMSAMVAERERSNPGGLSRSSEMDWRPTSNFR
jgi:hypothetical protein